MKGKELIESCYSIGGLSLELFGRCNKIYTEKTIKFMNDHGYDKDFFKGRNKNRKYEYLVRICPVCHTEFKTIIKHRKERETCSIACSNSFRPKRKKNPPRPRNKKTQKKRNDYNKNCVICGNEFTGTQKAKSCSEECKIEILKRKMRERVESGNHKGWTSRNIESYPEKFFKKVLSLNEILYKFNYPVSKKSLGISDSSSYFLDFFIEINGKKLDLEIDGKQHEMDERKESDLRRDGILINNGYLVHRIKWKNPVNEVNKKYIKDEIGKLLELIGSL